MKLKNKQKFPSKCLSYLFKNKYGCQYNQIKQPSVISGNYTFETKLDSYNMTFRISSNKVHSLYESQKHSETFQTQRLEQGVYRLCFTPVRIFTKAEKQKGLDKTPITLKLQVDVQTILDAKSDKLGSTLLSISDTISKVQNNYGFMRKDELKLQSQMSKAKRLVVLVVQFICSKYQQRDQTNKDE